MIVCGVVCGTTYALTRGISYLCTRPAPNDRLQTLRTTLSGWQEKVKQSLGGHYWSVASDIVWDNLWVSAFALSLLLTFGTPPPVSWKMVGECTIFVLGTAVLSWAGRLGLAHLFNSFPQTTAVGQWVAPKISASG